MMLMPFLLCLHYDPSPFSHTQVLYAIYISHHYSLCFQGWMVERQTWSVLKQTTCLYGLETQICVNLGVYVYFKQSLPGLQNDLRIV